MSIIARPDDPTRLAHARALELVVDGVERGGALLPEGDLHVRGGVLPLWEKRDCVVVI